MSLRTLSEMLVSKIHEIRGHRFQHRGVLALLVRNSLWKDVCANYSLRAAILQRRFLTRSANVVFEVIGVARSALATAVTPRLRSRRTHRSLLLIIAFTTLTRSNSLIPNKNA